MRDWKLNRLITALLFVTFLTSCSSQHTNKNCILLDVKYDENYNPPYTDIVLNGKPIQAFIDTGGNFEITADKNILDEKDLSPKRIKMQGLDGKIKKLKTFNGKVKIKDRCFHNVIIQEYKDWSYDLIEFAENKNIEENKNYIGINFLKHFNLYLNFKKTT
ncbi:MAG: hypothetical protein Q8S21_00155 [Candidatus Paracaedibacteraceae bacterium]|nr:hypothetical protein [Candidatus Paracaedibacteraceae bacterium]